MFLEDDTEAVLEYMQEKAAECPGCGLPRYETMDRANQHSYYAEPVRCHACAARERESNRFHRDPSDPSAVMWSIHRYEAG